VEGRSDVCGRINRVISVDAQGGEGIGELASGRFGLDVESTISAK
jgi:hypothetical protein